MERFCCCVQGCGEEALFRCEKSHSNLFLCNTHRRAHRVDCEYQRMHNKSRQERKSRIIYGLIPESYILSKNIKLICSQNSGEFACLHTIPVSIPTDYYESLKRMSHTFIDIIMKIPKAKIDLFVPYECKMFKKALKMIVYNIKVDEDSFIKKVLEVYKKYHSELFSCLITGISAFLNKAENELLLPRLIKKMLFFNLDLEEEKQKFLYSYLDKDYIDFQNFHRQFYSFFKDFIGDKYRDLSRHIETLETQYKNDLMEQKKICEESLANITCKLWDEIAYQRLAIFVYVIPGDLEAVCISNNWIMISCMVLVREKIKFHSIVELSERELLITLRIKKNMEDENVIGKNKKYDYYFIYYNGFESSLVNILSMDLLMVASGSTMSNVIICYDKPYRFANYAIENKAMVEKNEFAIGIDAQEVVTGLVFISYLNKLLISTANESIISYVIGEFKVKIPLNLNGETCVDLKYYPEKNLILFKTPNLLKVFNSFMQLIKSFDIEGNQAVGIVTLNSEIMIFIMSDQSLVGIRTDSDTYEPYAPSYSTFVKVENCLSWSFDFDSSNNGPKKYDDYIHRTFSVPDSHLDLEASN
ncbi:hypothetical protein SteCoe_27479 [Stentor coeruleus]|uniref:Uncharacterized protein n=1 Tax=Stentor coeruleus TaxID=5963 RepID=A0A1R2BAG2_9CILI|nr:hypothetical protein SteCoe_27479 [Stentor coeruleus]